MDNLELLQAIRQIVHEETDRAVEKKISPIVDRLSVVENDVSDLKVELKATEQQLREEIKASSQQTTKDIVALVDALFMKQFNLLLEGQEAILRKMPSEDDMDIIDGTLQEHDEILKVHDQEIEKLKIAL